MPEQQNPKFLNAPPQLPAGPDPYRTATRPRRPSTPLEPSPALQAPPVERPAPPPPAELDPKEALFRAKLAAAHAANHKEASAAAWGALGIVVIGTLLVIVELATPRTMIMIRRVIPAIAVIIPCIVIAAGYLLHYFLRRAQGKSL